MLYSTMPHTKITAAIYIGTVLNSTFDGLEFSFGGIKRFEIQRSSLDLRLDYRFEKITRSTSSILTN